MKLFKIVLILLTVLLLVRFFTKSFSPPVEEGTNEFSSNYYSAYHQQLKKFINNYPQIHSLTEISKEINDLVYNINQPLGDASEQRKAHENFIYQIRAVIDSIPQSPSNDKATSEIFLNNLIDWVYLQANMREATEAYFDRFAEVPIKTDYSNLLSSLQALRKDKIFTRAPHETEHTIDQYLHGNLPSFLFTLKNPSQTKVLRMGYPMDSLNKWHLPWITPTVYPEFLSFIKNQPRHLYINLMKRKGSESSATKALENLENNFSNIVIVTLDKNSDFYWQDAKKYPETVDSTEFKQIFLRHLINKKGNFYWSKSLNRNDWTKKLIVLLDEIHNIFFSNQATLNQKDRLDFIEIGYLSILDALVETLQPTSMNITCRQCMDRGPSLYALWMLQKNEVTARELPALLLAPPLLIHNRPSHLSRITRFISAAQRISSFQ